MLPPPVELPPSLLPEVAIVTPLWGALGDAMTGLLASANAWGGSLMTIELLGRIVSALFMFAFGACVGSFLNVVVYRLPAGLSVVTPPSRCPTCGGRLRWRENLPVLGWLLLRGSCRFCRQSISIQYPLIETLVGLLFAGLYLLFFATPSDSVFASIVSPWWRAQGFGLAWPVFIPILVMIAALVAATIVDARHYIIPGEITWTIALAGVAGAMVQPVLALSHRAKLVAPPFELVANATCGVALGGSVGLVIANILLRLGIIPLSYADFDQFVKEGDKLSSYPHARRETLKELLFLFPTVLCATIGGFIAHAVAPGPAPTGPLTTIPWLPMVSTALFGLLVGGGILWLVRIGGTFCFGKEAMGLGDVHLLAAIGTILGWKGATWTFAITLPVAIGYTIVGLCLRPIIRLPIREMPLGPHIAVAAVITLLASPYLRTLDPMLGQGFANLWYAIRFELGF